MIARSIGAVFVIAGVTGLISIAFPVASYGSVPLAAVVSMVACAIGALLLTGLLDGRSPRAHMLVLALATLVATVAVYAAGAPISGAAFFYVWVTPYAFALLSSRQAAAQTALMAVCSGGVLLLLAIRHPAIGSIGALSGFWFISVVTVVIVGTLVRRLSRSLRDVDRRFHHAFESSRVGAAFLTGDLEWIEVNDAFCSMLGWTHAQLVGRSALEITAPEDVNTSLEAIVNVRAGLTELEKRYLRPGGEVVWVAVTASLITPDVGTPYVFAQYRDITEHKRDRETLAYQAVHDPLTGLFNRTLLLDRLETALARRERRGDHVGVILLDLDQFKVVNDSLGHHAGDEVLVELAPRLAAAIGPRDTLARFGGDEFVVLCDRVNGPLEAIDRASRLANALATPVELATGSHLLTASIGVAIDAGLDDNGQTLLRDADAAMYRAKAAGRGRIELFDQSMRSEAIARLQLEHDLRAAIPDGQLVLEYQPIVDSSTQRTVALEALVRWDHPTRGRLGPDEFIPLAEETGLIVPLGDWVLATGSSQLATWQRQVPLDPPLRLSVNVSPAQLAVEGFVDRVAHVLRRTTLAPDSIAVELTETVFLQERIPTQTFADLHALGIRILLDDFGTGYSSLAYLTRFPIDALKIDRSFISRLDGTTRNAAIIRAILAIARELELDVVAEGVEHIGQLEQLQALGCPHAQGYAIAKPLPHDRVAAHLARQASSLRRARAV